MTLSVINILSKCLANISIDFYNVTLKPRYTNYKTTLHKTTLHKLFCSDKLSNYDFSIQERNLGLNYYFIEKIINI